MKFVFISEEAIWPFCSIFFEPFNEFPGLEPDSSLIMSMLLNLLRPLVKTSEVLSIDDWGSLDDDFRIKRFDDCTDNSSSFESS